MSMWYDFASVLILNWTVPPWFTLIDVANPWIDESPDPVICQSLCGSPALLFSQVMTLTTGAQGSAADPPGAIRRGPGRRRPHADGARTVRGSVRCCRSARRDRTRSAGTTAAGPG